MADYDSIVIVNEGYEIRNGKVVVTVKSEPLAVNLDPKALGRGPAQAIAYHLKEKVKGIAERAPAATLRYRKEAANAFTAGKAWALKRYSGGRMGPRSPNQSDRAFNDSGRFEESITANGSSDGTWRVNVAANRLTPNDSGGFERMWARLIQLVPEFADAARLLGQDLVKAAIAKSQRDMVMKMAATSKNTSIEAAIAVFRLLEVVADTVQAFTGT